MINDKDYWTNYYANAKVPETPSPFAQFLIDKNYLNESDALVELGCGNGRDARFFAKNLLEVTAIDQCQNTTEILNELDHIRSYAADFVNLPPFDQEIVDVVYSRFTMHSISEEGENKTLQWAYNNLKPGGLFCVEVRTVKDPIFGKGIDKQNNTWFYNDHHRRFVEADVFKSKLEQLGFEIVYFEEKNGFAKYKDEDPIVLRSIVRKA